MKNHALIAITLALLLSPTTHAKKPDEPIGSCAKKLTGLGLVTYGEEKPILSGINSQSVKLLKETRDLLRIGVPVRNDNVRILANQFIHLSDSFGAARNDLMKPILREKVIAAEKTKSTTTVEVLEDWTHILFSSNEVIKTSALEDFLRSPLADDSVIEQNLKYKLSLDFQSLWRISLATEGVTRDTIKVFKTSSGMLDFQFLETPASNDVKQDRAFFRNQFLMNRQHLLEQYQLIGKARGLSVSSEDVFNSETSFEALLLDPKEKQIKFPGFEAAQSKVNKDFGLLEFKNRSYNGLSEKGLALIKEARDALRARKTMFDKDFQNMNSIYKAVTEARIGKFNAILSGPPGAAKSAVINTFLDGENVPKFKIQVHGMTPEIPMIGGQTYESAQNGTYDHNIEGSLADHVVAIIDEGEKGPAGTLAALLSVLNERKVFAGGKEFEAKTRTVYATTNSSLSELMDHFVQGGQPKVGKAWANRFLYKVWISNWLANEQQKILDDRNEKKDTLKAYAANDSSFLNDEVFAKFPPVQWEELQSIARALFKFNDMAKVTYRDIAKDLRTQTNVAIKTSEKNHADDSEKEPFVYTPAADWSERLRQQIPEAALYSAFHDFLLSPLADDENLVENTSARIELDSASLWRLYSTSAMISSGSVYPTIIDGKFDLKFERVLKDGTNILDPTEARDQSEAREIENMIAEQDRFRESVLKHNKDLQKHIMLIMEVRGGRGHYNPGMSFELQLLKAFKGRKYP